RSLHDALPISLLPSRKIKGAPDRQSSTTAALHAKAALSCATNLHATHVALVQQAAGVRGRRSRRFSAFAATGRCGRISALTRAAPCSATTTAREMLT